MLCICLLLTFLIWDPFEFFVHFWLYSKLTKFSTVETDCWTTFWPHFSYLSDDTKKEIKTSQNYWVYYDTVHCLNFWFLLHLWHHRKVNDIVDVFDTSDFSLLITSIQILNYIAYNYYRSFCKILPYNA